jgi:general secretion pathway protein F
MSQAFELVVRTPQGALQTLRLAAADLSAARADAVSRGHAVLTCEAVNGATRSSGGIVLPWRGANNAKRENAPKTSALSALASRKFDVPTFALELAALLKAGLGMVEALSTLSNKEQDSAGRQQIAAVQRTVSEGQPLSQALGAQAIFSPLLVATVSASEQTGDLPVALERYAKHQLEIQALKDKVVGAAVYPLLLLAVGTVVVLFLLGVVVPKFAGLIETSRRELPVSSQILLAWGRTVAAHPWVVGGIVLAFAIALGLTIRKAMREGASSTLIVRLPLVGPLARQFRHSQLYRTTGMLVRGGIAAPKALQLASSLLSSDDKARLDAAIVKVQQGEGVSKALQSAGLADPVASSMLTVAERTGALADILERIADFHESQLKRAIDLASRLFEPLLMIVIGLVIGAIVVLMYLPIFDLASSLQ